MVCIAEKNQFVWHFRLSSSIPSTDCMSDVNWHYFDMFITVSSWPGGVWAVPRHARSASAAAVSQDWGDTGHWLCWQGHGDLQAQHCWTNKVNGFNILTSTCRSTQASSEQKKKKSFRIVRILTLEAVLRFCILDTKLRYILMFLECPFNVFSMLVIIVLFANQLKSFLVNHKLDQQPGM